MPLQNLTGVPSVWGDLNLASSTINQLSAEEELKRKKKLMGASTSEFGNVSQYLFGLNKAGNPMV